MTTSDTKFFTNEAGNTLYDRFNHTLKSAKYFDVLVGYFRSSGFYRLYEPLENVEKIRILVGINTDYEVYKAIMEARQLNMFGQQLKTKQFFNEALVKEFENSEDTQEVETSVTKFKELLKSGKLEIRAFANDKIHAKVYISRYEDDAPIYGSVITGSSNFTENGLEAQYEFNVELKDTPDVKFAQEKFEALWAKAVDVSLDYVETINSKTWLNDEVTPYEIYLKFLYEYFYEDINAEECFDIDLPDNYMKLDYQINAVATINRIVNDYKGIFIADVVGLGKTYISAMYAQTLNGRKLVLAPPPIMPNWREAFRDFGVKKYEIESVGMLHKIVEKIDKSGENPYDYIFVDEAHRFRNGETTQYEMLKRICLNKKVILVSATPLNNSFYDFKALINLFQKGNACDIPGTPSLDAFFAKKRNELREIEKQCNSKNAPAYIEAIKAVSKEVRTKILIHIMVRRTRTDIKNRFESDMKKRGLFFPEVKTPERIIYEFDPKTDAIFEKTIEMIKSLTYARYTPKLYLNAQLSEFEKTQQRNLLGFMKSRLVKRLESSKHAFQMTLKRTIASYKKYIDMYNSGYIYISKDVNIFDYIDNDNTDALDKLVDNKSGKEVEKFPSSAFSKSFIDNLKSDLDLLETAYKDWTSIKTDFKKEKFAAELKSNKLLNKNKLVIFTESKETGEDLYEALQKDYGTGVLFYSSSQSAVIKETIKENFDPNSKVNTDDVRILITTDVLAEGINLHRSNVIINYDLPWNPTKILQRVGRVNRVGTEHKAIHIFNFFPTAKTDKELDLESNIIAKIQAFHNALGEDAQYLSDTEEFTSFDLYKRLTSSNNAEDEEENIELKYLSIIREIRDKNTALFKKVGALPKKIRTARNFTDIEKDSLITFFRKGRLKKFCITQGITSTEIPFEDAVKYFECNKNETKTKLPKHYFNFLEINKQLFEQPECDADTDMTIKKGRSNQRDVVQILQSMLKEPRFIQDEREYLHAVITSYNAGIIPDAITKKLKKALKLEVDNLKALAVLKNTISDNYLNSANHKKDLKNSQKQIILSEFLEVSNE